MENPKQSMFAKPWVQSITGIIVLSLLSLGFVYFKSTSSYINVEDSMVSAPVISISTETSGILDEVYVKAGDEVTDGEPLARVGSEILKSKINGTIIYTSDTPGQVFNSSQPIIKMINPEDLRIVGTVKENSGLSKIVIGDPVYFTVDAFAGERYTGIVDEISETSKDTSVVFSISDKREVKEFTIKVRYNTSLYKKFKNGMSAKIKVYKI
ncbi:HlyD family efflux transporter periplasmic adaptor subunit [Candidatus Nomurabacteria bacterium]|nr:HlyD family efflux transporter periplasmic adaptor subunit [Candidatus Nomurabacteria bacterium]